MRNCPWLKHDNEAFVRVEQIEYKTGIKAKLRFHEKTKDGLREKVATVKNGTDLFALSNLVSRSATSRTL